MRIGRLIREWRIGVFVFGKGVKSTVWSMGMGCVEMSCGLRCLIVTLMHSQFACYKNFTL